MDLLLKDGKNGSRRVASLELGGEWVRTEILPRAFFVCIQGIIDNELKIG